MSARSLVIREAFQFAYEALDRTLEGIDDREFKYRLRETSNNIQDIVNHLSRITNVNMMTVIKGNHEYSPAGWPDDYINQEHSLEQLKKDIENGREKVLDGITGLTDEQIEEVIPMMSGLYPRKIGLYAYLGEVFHHRGQINFIRGTIKRLREKNPEFLS
jgi:uncharacterized damage-inducible protein DinB